MNPFYFGTSEHRLYGVFHPPAGSAPRDCGVVLCYPLGQEYMRCHRAFRQLTTLLTKAGYPVLRFDYFGTGDSGGESVEGDLDRWVADIRFAVDELEDTAGVSTVSLIGLRLGASLAARATHGRTDIADLVLWDPIVFGAPYLRDLISFSEDTGSGANGNGGGPEGGTIDVRGFPLTPKVRSGISGVDLTRLDTPPVRRILVVVSHESDDFGKLHEHLARQPVSAQYELIPSAANWHDVDDFGSMLMPQQIVQGIVTWLT